MNILLTGASGFIGGAILNAAKKCDLKIRPVYRSLNMPNVLSDSVFISKLDGKTDWLQALQEIDVVIHAAALTHTMLKDENKILDEYRQVNVDGTLNLARQAAESGVRRFVFISSIKVNGEVSVLGRPFTADDIPSPESAYGKSKAEAEESLKLVAEETGMEITIIRPPLVYGKGVKGNFGNLLSFLRRGYPLPFGSITKNRRSLVSLDNLVDLIFVCLSHPNAANQIFLISDMEDLSTYELLMKIGKVLGQEPYLPRVPIGILSFIIKMLGMRHFSQSLLCSLQVDVSKTYQVLDWKPLVSLNEGLRKAVE